MKCVVTSLVLSLLLGCAGCMSPDIAVIDMVSGKMVSPPNASMRQVVVSVDHKAQTFCTIVKQDSLFRLTVFDSSCHKVTECTVPAFTSGYCGSTSYALSRDGGRLVYLKDNTRNLYLFDIVTHKETVLWEDIANSSMGIPYLGWVSGSNILAVLPEYPGADRRTNAVVVLDIPSGERRTVYEPTYPASFDYALSPDGSLLAFADGNKRHDIDGVIKVLDIRRGVVQATLGSVGITRRSHSGRLGDCRGGRQELGADGGQLHVPKMRQDDSAVSRQWASLGLAVGSRWLDRFLAESREQRIFVPAQSDMSITTPNNGLTVLFCHESDIHLSGQDAAPAVPRVRSRA